MSLDEIITFNEKFVANEKYKKYETDSIPNKRMVVLTCMESRLVELLPKALNIQNGDVKMLKNAGAILRRPFDNMTKSILFAIHNLQAEIVLIVGHYDCGMSNVNIGRFLDNMKKNGIPEETIQLIGKTGVDFEEEFAGFQSVEESIRESVHLLRNHPLLPTYVKVHGLIMDPKTGKVDVVTEQL